MKKLIMFGVLAVATTATAQVQVPAIQNTAFVMSMPDSDPVQLSPKEQKALDIAREWKNNPSKPRKSADGGAIYLYGSTLPTVVCKVLEMCAIRLQPGELVNHVHAGDQIQWDISPALIGSGPNAITVVMVTPREHATETTIHINTDRRSYVIKLMSTRKGSVSYIAFDYPDDNARAWAAYRAKQGQVAHANTLPSGQSIERMDFDYIIGGDNPAWTPIRVYNNGTKTTIQFADAKFGGEAPLLFVVEKSKSLWSAPSEKMVNYRPVGDTFEVDEVIKEAVLIVGVGDDQRQVTITKGKGK